jgi:hypothetical protein
MFFFSILSWYLWPNYRCKNHFLNLEVQAWWQLSFIAETRSLVLVEYMSCWLTETFIVFSSYGENIRHNRKEFYRPDSLPQICVQCYLEASGRWCSQEGGEGGGVGGGHIRGPFWSLEVSLSTSVLSTCRKQGQRPALSPRAPTHKCSGRRSGLFQLSRPRDNLADRNQVTKFWTINSVGYFLHITCYQAP